MVGCRGAERGSVHDRASGHADLAKRLETESRACGYLIDECLRRDLTISVNDGEGWCLLRSRNRHAIMCALASTDSDCLLARDPSDHGIARFYLIYGNDGYDVIADFTDNTLANAIYDAIKPQLDKLEAECA